MRSAPPSTLGTELSSSSLPSILLVPLGATEQHGPHLPLATDSIIAQCWAEAVADRHPDAVAAPCVPYGSSGEHQDFPGTLSIGQEALAILLVELARSASHHFAKVVFLVGHGGNQEPVTRALSQLETEGHDVRAFYANWPVDQFDLDVHAGRTETSLMLHLAPHLVATELAEPGLSTPLGEIIDSLRSDGVRAVSPNGVLGDPTEASAAEGSVLFNYLVNSVDLAYDRN